MNKLIDRLFKKERNGMGEKIIDRKQEAIIRAAREQFLKLKEKGLSIPIFTF